MAQPTEQHTDGPGLRFTRATTLTTINGFALGSDGATIEGVRQVVEDDFETTEVTVWMGDAMVAIRVTSGTRLGFREEW